MQYSIVAISEIASNFDFRIDAECYTPYHIEVERAISKKNFNLVEDYAVSVINFGAYSLCNYIEFLDSGKPFLVTEDIGDNVIETSRLHYISEEVHLLLHKSHCFKGQVLLTMAGAYLGQAAVFNENFECSSNQAIAKITLKPNSINPYYLSTFLNCRYGQSQIERFRTGTGQPNLNLGLIKTIKVVEPSNHFQGTVDKGVNTALELRREGVNLYEEAQTLLLSELELTDWQPKHQLTFVKNHSDVKQAERIDAEYYQPKYDDIIDIIKGYLGGWDRLGNLCEIRRGSLIEDSFYDPKEGNPYIRGADFSGGWLSDDKLVFINPKFRHTNETRVCENDIIFSLIGSVGETALVTSEFTGAYISNNTGKIECESPVFSVFLQTLLTSIIGKMYFEKYKTQTAQPKISDKDLHNFVIPLISEEKQTEIQQTVVESFNLRKQSKHLLECAKRAVEIAIEGDEQTAIDYLDRETQELNNNL